jgi:hypothetical protein
VDNPSEPIVTITERGFGHVDAEAAALIAALDDQASLPAIQRLRTAAPELLRPQAASAAKETDQ